HKGGVGNVQMRIDAKRNRKEGGASRLRGVAVKKIPIVEIAVGAGIGDRFGRLVDRIVITLAQRQISLPAVSVALSPFPTLESNGKENERKSGGGLRPRREAVAEGAARRALHQGLVARQADLAAAGRNDVEIGRADQHSAELRLAERAKEFRETAVRDVEFQRL